MVGLVHNQILESGQHQVAGGDIRQQQRMIDDDDVRLLGSLAGYVQRAALFCAHLPIAAVIVGAEAAPDEPLPRPAQA